MKIWITGAGGSLGTAITRLCAEKKIPFFSTTKHEVNIASLREVEEKAWKEAPSHIINCAAYTKVDQAEIDSALAFEINARGPEILGQVAKQISAHVIHVSTDYIFSGETNRLYKESDTPNPQSVYGRTKWEGERRLLDRLPTACVIRTSWIFGKDAPNFLSSCFSAMKEKEELSIVSDQISKVTSLKDLSEAIMSALPQQGIFHFANEGAASRFELVEQMRRVALERGVKLMCTSLLPVPLASFSAQAKRPQYSALDTSKWERVFGVRPRHWKEIIGEFIDAVA